MSARASKIAVSLAEYAVMAFGQAFIAYGVTQVTAKLNESTKQRQQRKNPVGFVR